MTDCICQSDWDHAIGCPEQHTPIGSHRGCCEPRPYRLTEPWCPVHGAFTRWPADRGDYQYPAASYGRQRSTMAHGIEVPVLDERDATELA